MRARPLDAEAFAPFGEVTPRPTASGATVIVPVGAGINLRPGRAEGKLSWFAVPGSAWPVTARVMERHRFSSQGFVPCADVEWLVLTAPDGPSGGPSGGPDMARAAAFVAGPGQAVTLRPGVWHHPLTALRPASFAVLTFLAGDADDEEFHDLAESFVVEAPR